MPLLTALHPVLGAPGPDTDAVEESLAGFDSGQALTAGIIFAAGIVVALVVRAVVVRLLRPHNLVIARLVSRLAAALVVAVALVYALGEMGIRVGLVLGALGVGGIALAFALQDILSNLIAGIILQVRQPFTYRDLVSIADYEGTVTDVNLRSVEMRLLSGETVIIPSSTVLQNPIENWTRRPTRRLSVDVGVAYETDMDRAADLLVEALGDVADVLDDPAPVVAFDSFGDSSINFTAYFWFRSTGDFHVVKRRAATSIKRVLDREHIDIPFPIRVLQQAGGPGADDATGVSRSSSAG
jgi:small conductance mechanosensitive channel